MSDPKEQLKSMLQDLINDRPEQAQVTIHDYIVTKTQEVAGLAAEFVSESTNKTVLDLQAIVDELNQNRNIDEADLLKDGIEVQTRKGDLVTFRLNRGKLHAWVQGEKKDIDCGDIGNSTADILSFLNGINKAWYREYDEDFND